MPPPRPAGHFRRPRGAPREDVSTLVFDPANAIWLIACSDARPRGGNVAAMWWKYANTSDPTEGDMYTSHIWRMNNVRSAVLEDGHSEPLAELTTLKAAIEDSYSLDCEDLILLWHGIHHNAPHANTPHRLRNQYEEYEAELHGHSTPPVYILYENMRVGEERPRSFANYQAYLAHWHAEDPRVQDTPDIRRQYDEQVERDLNDSQAWVEARDEARRRRREWNESFPFNWRRSDRPDDWPGRYEATNYMDVLGALRGHPHVKRVHLYGCDLADPRFLGPILDLTKDLNEGAAFERHKEVWAYSDFTETDRNGQYLYISHSRHGPVGKGVKFNRYGHYEVVSLYTENGPLPGWQVRGRIESGRAIVEKLVERTSHNETERAIWWPEGRGYHVEVVDAEGMESSRWTDPGTIQVVQERDPTHPRGPTETQRRYPYTPVRVVPARDYHDPHAHWSIRDFMPIDR